MSNTAILIDRRRKVGERVIPIRLDVTHLTANTAAHMLRTEPFAVRSRRCAVEVGGTDMPCRVVFIHGGYVRGQDPAEFSFRTFDRNWNIFGSAILVGEDGLGLDERTTRELTYSESTEKGVGILGRLTLAYGPAKELAL